MNEEGRLKVERDFYKKDAEDNFKKKVQYQDALFAVLEAGTIEDAKRIAEAALLGRNT